MFKVKTKNNKWLEIVYQQLNNIPLYFRVVILNKRYSFKLIYDDVKVVTKQ